MPSPSASSIIGGVNAAEHTRGSILVVDDEPTIAEVVARYLERAGYVDSALERRDETVFYACSQLLTDRRFELAGLKRADREDT